MYLSGWPVRWDLWRGAGEDVTFRDSAAERWDTIGGVEEQAKNEKIGAILASLPARCRWLPGLGQSRPTYKADPHSVFPAPSYKLRISMHHVAM